MQIEKDYLTAGEIRYIAELLINMEDSDFMTKQYMKYLSVADFCTDFKLDIEKDENGGDITVWKEEKYNNLWADGGIEKLDKEIRNIYLIDEYVKDSQSTYKVFNNLTDKLSESLNNFNLEETKDVVSQIGNLINKESK